LKPAHSSTHDWPETRTAEALGHAIPSHQSDRVYSYDSRASIFALERRKRRRSHSSVTITASDGHRLATADFNFFLSKLKLPGDKIGEDVSPSILILATPQQKHLIAAENDLTLILVRQLVSLRPELKDRNIEVFLGIVDRVGLSPAERDMQPSSAEGVSIRVDLDVDVIVDEVDKPAYETTPGHVTFTCISLPRPYDEVAPFNSCPKLSESITFPLAETAMLNGSDFTLRRQKWSTTGPTMLSDAPINSIAIVQRASGYSQTRLSVPALYHRPLTPPRVISSAFGNVIRTLKKGGRGLAEIPASQEIEEKILTARTTLRDPDHGTEIWAAVRNGTSKTLWPYHRFGSVATVDSLIASGFSLYRVQGGGGGWEGKGGPVTLEVDHPHDKSHNRLHDDDFDEKAIEHYLSGANSKFQPGDIVQFYLVGESNFRFPDEDKGGTVLSNSLIISTLPADIQSIPPKPAGKAIDLKFGFHVLSRRVTVSTEAKTMREGYDHGASDLGLLHRSNLPPATSVSHWTDRVEELSHLIPALSSDEH